MMQAKRKDLSEKGGMIRSFPFYRPDELAVLAAGTIIKTAKQRLHTPSDRIVRKVYTMHSFLFFHSTNVKFAKSLVLKIDKLF